LEGFAFRREDESDAEWQSLRELNKWKKILVLMIDNKQRWSVP